MWAFVILVGGLLSTKTNPLLFDNVAWFPGKTFLKLTVTSPAIFHVSVIFYYRNKNYASRQRESNSNIQYWNSKYWKHKRFNRSSKIHKSCGIIGETSRYSRSIFQSFGTYFRLILNCHSLLILTNRSCITKKIK